MKAVTTSPNGLMQHTDCSLFASGNSSSLSEQTKTDTFEVCIPAPSGLPNVPLSTNPDLLGNLLYSVGFMVIFAFVRLKGKNLFHTLLNVVVNRKKAEIMLNEGIASNLFCYILSLCLSFSILAGLLSFVLYGHFLSLDSLYYFLSLTGYHFTLLSVIRTIGWTFNARNTADEVRVNLWTYHIISGLIVSPFVISAFFVKSFAVMPLLKIVMFSLILLLFLKIIRWIEILFIRKVSILYMILYLCTLEIMPLLILYKIVA